VSATLVARLDGAGDVLLAGPAVRAAATRGAPVTLLCGPRGAAAGRLLPGVAEVLVLEAPWIEPEPRPVDGGSLAALVDRVRRRGIDEAHLLTSFHQSALPLALLLRLAGVAFVAAISEDYPGSLLDIRHPDPGDVHEVERSLSLLAAAGRHLPPGDDARLRVRRTGRLHPAAAALGEREYVAVHPGASVSARAWAPERCADLVEELVEAGWPVVVTGGVEERALTAVVAGRSRPGVVDLGGTLDLEELAEVLGAAACVVVGNTGPAHLAAAVGTPVVSLFAPTVPAVRWRPWGVPHRLLGDQRIACAGCRARRCPVPGHPCIGRVPVAAVLEAVAALARPALAAAAAPPS
jgi:ADP-heptose:LPS heptosyltransferase